MFKFLILFWGVFFFIHLFFLTHYISRNNVTYAMVCDILVGSLVKETERKRGLEMCVLAN